MANDTPIQPVPEPILNGPYEEPTRFWQYNRITGEAQIDHGRRPAKYWYKAKDEARGQLSLELDEGQDDLPLVNQLRSDVRRWREHKYEGATPTTKELLQWWWRADRPRRLFFCQLEAVETVIYLREILRSNRRPRFKPQFQSSSLDELVDRPADEGRLPLVRFGCKMATGSGKTVVMAMLTAWSFCNRARGAGDERFPSAVLVCCPNLTVKERLQVLRPEVAGNYYDQFEIAPVNLRPLMRTGKVLVTNWHAFAPQSEHHEAGSTFAVVNKGEETNDAFARRVLKDLYDRLPLMVLNDEAHHCYRPKPAAKLTKEDKAEREEATRWIEGLDRINNCRPGEPAKPGVSVCVDLSATPFYIGGSGYTEGKPFPWLVSDFGLVDAIESGIVKIPRLPVSDTTGRPDAAYFRLWQHVTADLEPGHKLPGGKPKPQVVYERSQAALLQLANQWKERFDYFNQATPGVERLPPVLIVVCDNTDVAEVFYRKISGERVGEVVTEQDVREEREADGNGDAAAPKPGRAGKAARAGRQKAERQTFHGRSEVLAEFANTPQRAHTIRIDTKLLSEAEAEEGGTKADAAERLRRVVASVGRRGEPGEHVRCVVSVAMLTEGWDANNVTHIFGVRAFGSQLLCEQVVGRGLRRIDYTPDPRTGRLQEENVDVYGIPFTVIPFKGREANQKAPEDRPKNHVRAVEERQGMEIRFPVVESYAFSLRHNLVRCDVARMEGLTLEPNLEPTATYLLPQVGYQEGKASQHGPFAFRLHDRQGYYRENHIQTIKFRIGRLVVDSLIGASGNGSTGAGAVGKDAARKQRVLRLQSRHQLFPQVYRYVDDYVSRKVDFRHEHPSELGLERYVKQVVERLRDAIEPDDAAGEPPLLPILNAYKPTGTTADVEFKTTRPCHGTRRSHVDQVVLDTLTWESAAAFRLEQAADAGTVAFYARNDHLGLVVPYEYQGISHGYEPDFVVRLPNGTTLLVEIKGQVTNQDKAKHEAAAKWVRAVNHWGGLGRWAFHVCYDPQKLAAELRTLATWAPLNVGAGA